MSTKSNAILAVTLTALVSAHTHVQAENNIGYLFDSSNKIVRNSSGECWRTIKWSEANAIAECEGGKAKKVVAMVTDGDSDNDGVVDSKDQCKNTVMGAEVDSRGCVLDSDNDGVADSKDVCKNTVRGVIVDSKGCAIDSDKDGIADVNDDCSGTAAGTVVNTRGCELKANISLDKVQFRSGTAELSPYSRGVLDYVAAVLRANRHLKFEVAGHTDNSGNYQNNVNLSAGRASSVKQYLVGRGVDSNNLSANGYGPDKPVASNDSASGREQNRRVELLLKK